MLFVCSIKDKKSGDQLKIGGPGHDVDDVE